jgi:4'-phosphopantetheinyl transferase
VKSKRLFIKNSRDTGKHVLAIGSDWKKSAHGAVHLWRVGLDAFPQRASSLLGLLSDEERERLERFRFPVLKHRFAVARGTLRQIVAQYVGGDPVGLQFGYERFGKPFVQSPPSNLHFNLSHSVDLMVVAVSMETPVGVDIEREDRELKFWDIAAHYFSQSEQEELALRKMDSRQRAFFQIWTAKEAVLKASSLGFSVEPSHVEIGLTPLTLRAIKGVQERNLPWYLEPLSPREGYIGALAVASQPSKIEYYDFPSA